MAPLSQEIQYAATPSPPSLSAPVRCDRFICVGKETGSQDPDVFERRPTGLEQTSLCGHAAPR